ncbi:MAG: SLC13 family permease [Thermoanaerobaculaceae bacterium]
MDHLVLVIYAAVYLGMLLGEIPPLAVDRTGFAILGAIALVVTGRVTPQMGWEAVDVATIALLAGLMVVSAQFRLAGFYTYITRRLAATALSPPWALASVMAVAAGLSAVLVNDVVCLAMAPILIESCARKGWDPVPFLLGLAMAANVGSAATIIGNPQNILIAQKLSLAFTTYALEVFPVVLLSLLVCWLVLTLRQKGQWYRHTPIPKVSAPPFSPYQAGKGLVILLALLVLFLADKWPREVAALAAAGVLLTSRRMASREMLGLVDWQLLALFVGLFVVNHAFLESGWMGLLHRKLSALGLNLEAPGVLFWSSALLSNVVSNVPAVMLLLPSASHPTAGPLLAVASTLAGNLLLVGSIANLIVADQAAQLGVQIDARTHARVGVPATVITLALAYLWLAVGFPWTVPH